MSLPGLGKVGGGASCASTTAPSTSTLNRERNIDGPPSQWQAVRLPIPFQDGDGGARCQWACRLPRNRKEGASRPDGKCGRIDRAARVRLAPPGDESGDQRLPDDLAGAVSQQPQQSGVL